MKLKKNYLRVMKNNSQIFLKKIYLKNLNIFFGYSRLEKSLICHKIPSFENFEKFNLNYHLENFIHLRYDKFQMRHFYIS